LRWPFQWVDTIPWQVKSSMEIAYEMNNIHHMQLWQSNWLWSSQWIAI